MKEDSIKKRVRRANQRAVEDEMRQRENAGLKPYAVQVRSSGLIDNGCRGHLKWQEIVKDLTPRMLDMSVIKYEDQEESSRKMLRDTMFNKFEFIDHEVTDNSFVKMIKTWLRRDRERVRRLHGGKQRAPAKYNQQQWIALKKYWDSPVYKSKSEKMSETRSRVIYNPRLGRHGYAGHEAKLVSLFIPNYSLGGLLSKSADECSYRLWKHACRKLIFALPPHFRNSRSYLLLTAM
ncbi:hypothetical protein M758_UG319300 [Ceratodon purpureus]|nr:hypothetical protein M758_UG319300 [Ceratodon purpureus]